MLDVAPMATLLTHRDLELFRALAGGPLTVRQILKLSATFPAPFPSKRRLQRRLHKIAVAGLLKKWRYATEGPGIEAYSTLSPHTYRLLYEGDSPLPGRSWGPIGISRQRHTRCLAEFHVHTAVAAQAAGCVLSEVRAENTLRLEANGRHLYPDRAFTLLVPGRPPLKFFVELDNGTEPVSSPRERESWQQKLAFYEALQDSCDYRFRVLGIVTRTAGRLENVVTAAAEASHNTRRPLFYGITLHDYLAEQSPLTHPCFRDHRGQAVALVPPARIEAGAA